MRSFEPIDGCGRRESSGSIRACSDAASALMPGAQVMKAETLAEISELCPRLLPDEAVS